MLLSNPTGSLVILFAHVIETLTISFSAASATSNGGSLDPFTERGAHEMTILHLAVERQSFSEDAVRILKSLLNHAKCDVALKDDQGIFLSDRSLWVY